MVDYETKRRSPEYLNVDEFFRGAPTCSISEDVHRQIEKEREAEGPLDPDALRAAEDWNELGDLVFGQEHLGPQRFP